MSKMREAGGTSESFATFFQHLCALQLPDQHSLLNQLTGKELAKLLKSLGKPSFQGKKKEKQVLTVIETRIRMFKSTMSRHLLSNVILCCHNSIIINNY